ncbi:MAG: DUF2818 family protein [Azoarcus sp.]|nr:DUF2818 family protein [Azoarcus sp.]
MKIAVSVNTIAVWVVLGLAFIAANLPFIFDSVLCIWNYKQKQKPLGIQFLELILFYFLVALFAILLEKKAYGGVYRQSWEFFVATFCLFLVFAFPGFVYSHLWRSRRRRSGGNTAPG